jgi:peroxiredoxin family protein
MKVPVCAATGGLLLAVTTSVLAAGAARRTYEVAVFQTHSKATAKKDLKAWGLKAKVFVVEREEGKPGEYQVEKPFPTKKAAENYRLQEWYTWQRLSLNPRVEVDS